MAAVLDASEIALRAELIADVQTLAGEIGERNMNRYPQLLAAADFIEASLTGAGLVGMISLETIAYFSDAPRSQKYPSPGLGFFYPNKGNFIGFAGDTRSRSLLRSAVSAFRKTGKLPCEGASLPAIVPGIGWSDHWSFWQCGYPAVMVTDTAPFRYPHYHEPTDTPEKLDYDRFALVVSGLENTIAALAE